MVEAVRLVYNQSPLFKLNDAVKDPQPMWDFCSRGMLAYYETQIHTQHPFDERREYVLDKSRAWMFQYEWLEAMFVKPKVVMVIRDIRAILSSMEKQRRKNPHLLNGMSNPGQMRHLTIDQRVSDWMSTPPLGLSLACLSDLMQRNKLKDCHVIRYEDLVKEPQECMGKLYEFLEVPNFEHDFKQIAQTVEEDDTIHGLFGDHQVRSELIPVKNDWNEILGKEISATVVRNNRWFYDAFYPNL